jgi:hypothetical protein
MPSLAVSFLFAIACLVILACQLQSPSNGVHIAFCGLAALRRLLLERVKDIDDLFKLYRVEGTIGISIEILDDSKTPGPSPFHGLAEGCLPPNCATPSALPITHFVFHGRRKLNKIGL